MINALPDNYQLSVSRFQVLLQRLKQKPAILEEYDDIMQDQLTEGIIEAFQPDETQPGVVHYLPHHAVVRWDKTTTKVPQLEVQTVLLSMIVSTRDPNSIS